MKLGVFFLSLIFFVNSHAAQLEGISFNDSYLYKKNTLVLNGLGLRKVSIVFVSIKVYVAGLYLKKKTRSSDEIINAKEPRVLILKFKRDAEKHRITNGWNKAFEKNCFLECQKNKKRLSEFNEQMVDMKEGGIIKLIFDETQLILEVHGKKEKKSKTFNSKSFSQNILSMFVGSKVEDKDLRSGLLGLK